MYVYAYMSKGVMRERRRIEEEGRRAWIGLNKGKASWTHPALPPNTDHHHPLKGSE